MGSPRHRRRIRGGASHRQVKRDCLGGGSAARDCSLAQGENVEGGNRLGKSLQGVLTHRLGLDVLLHFRKQSLRHEDLAAGRLVRQARREVRDRTERCVVRASFETNLAARRVAEGNPDPEVESSVDPLKVTVAKSGEYWINDQKYDLDTTIELLSSEHASEPLRRLVLRADAKLQYGEVREIFARSQRVGFPGIALMVGERHRANGPTDQPMNGGES